MSAATHDYDGRRVTVMGLGRFGGGVGVTRFLAQRGADVRVTDTLPAAELAASVAQLEDCPGVSLRLGEHNVSDFTTCDLLVVNPAVKPGNRFVRAAQAAGVRVTSEIRLLARHLPDRRRTIGVTGSAGKSTVTAMIGHILGRPGEPCGESGPPSRFDDRTRVWVGGNLGGSLLEHVDAIGEDDWVVLELSSFMLEGLGEDKWSPHVAVITNICPNHLDWHGSMAAYVAAKRMILKHQVAGDVAFAGASAARALDPGGDPQDPTWHDFGTVDACVLSNPPGEENPTRLCRLPGRHNRLNATFASAVAEHVLMAKGATRRVSKAIDDALMSFPGLPHRLQLIAEHAGVRYYNDSKSTTPEAATLAIEAFDPRSVRIILGGSDKGSDLGPLARFAAERCVGIYAIGTTGAAIADAAEAAAAEIGAAVVRPDRCGAVAWPPPTATVRRCGTLEAALEAIAAEAKTGDRVVLSPACASWDQFANYEARGDAFVAWVGKRASASEG